MRLNLGLNNEALYEGCKVTSECRSARAQDPAAGRRVVVAFDKVYFDDGRSGPILIARHREVAHGRP